MGILVVPIQSLQRLQLKCSVHLRFRVGALKDNAPFDFRIDYIRLYIFICKYVFFDDVFMYYSLAGDYE